MARYGRGQPHQPLLSKAVTAVNPPGVATPNYVGTNFKAKPFNLAWRKKRLIVVPAAVVGPAPPNVVIPRYMGLNVKASPGARFVARKRVFLSQLRLVPRGGFPGAKFGFLSITPTRTVRNFISMPTRQANLTTQ